MTPDWPGDTAPLPRHVADDRLGKRLAELAAPITMTPDQWLGALAHAWELGHRDLCVDCNCPPERNPYWRSKGGR